MPPPNPAFKHLYDRRKRLLADADTIAAKADAEDRDLTPVERRQVVDHLEESKSITAELRAVEGGGTATATKADAGEWGRAVRKAGAKALVPSGTITVPAPWTEAVAGFGPSPSLLGTVIPTRNLDDTDSFSYLRQTVRTNNAAAVPRGELKPTSVISLEKIEDTARTIATLSEPIDNAWVADVRQLVDFISGELREMVNFEINTQVVQGAGGDDLTGLLNVTGRQTQAFDTDLLTTLRKARTKVGSVYDGLRPDWLLVHPNDAETLDLEQDNDGRFYFGGPIGAGPNEPVWRVPVRETKAVPEGTGVMSNFRASTLAYVREQTRIDWSEAVPVDIGGGELRAAFELNQRVYRAESRVGLAIPRPAAIVEIELSSGS